MHLSLKLCSLGPGLTLPWPWKLWKLSDGKDVSDHVLQEKAFQKKDLPYTCVAEKEEKEDLAGCAWWKHTHRDMTSLTAAFLLPLAMPEHGIHSESASGKESEKENWGRKSKTPDNRADFWA